MRRLAFLFLVLVLPLQVLLAAGQTYHVLGEGQDVVVYGVTHNHDHDHSHADGRDDHGDHSDSDHHHHCTGHCAVVLPTVASNVQPDLRYSEYSPVPVLGTSNYHTRIERPNWC